MGRVNWLVGVATALALSLAACGGGGADSCVDDGDCAEGVCGPAGRCQSGETGDPCEGSADCQFACGPADLCHPGMEGDPCISNTDCYFDTSGGGTTFECNGTTCEAEPQCVGTVTPCASLALVQCVETEGCDWVAASSSCVGVAEPCSQQNEITCEFQAGCRLE